MSIQTRRERERADREKLIVATARELAETEGWDAVTTRRLAEKVEYSQPVLYSHFRGKDAIVIAVALEGFAELAEQLRGARARADQTLAAVSRAYIAFADRHPALYDAMFSRSVDLPFATPDAPPALHAAFDELADAIRLQTQEDEVGLLTETFWAALHGLVTLTRSGRLPRDAADRRLELLLARFDG
ncbi:TetR/AcrR family transcriptional regulator [Amycolatopsis sp. GM8]|uniref:TetR/AcrR family transcriptional regulator n=1 Tax=Amycolatopsis sp. GM8 TaxID=2896530 RepID=UPI001F2A6104|nr:TetR/AcrR family transcriptional regulator [Amycolatopsis sp. GM8]